ncbi:hypothetical protein HA466_0176370 [Hirschfeldia incana]|nr:hypothetical protein HA466_0176370 [Hirschfeldia incana]
MDRSNNMNRAKRSFDGNDDQPDRKRPALASVIVEALKINSLQKLCSSLEPILRRVVSEEVERALAKVSPARLTGSSGSSPKRIEGPSGKNLRLQFRSRLSLPLFTGGRVEGEQGAAIHVVLIDANTHRAVLYGPEASAKLEVVVLEGDFTREDDEDWTQEEFESHVVKERQGKRPLLNGELYVTLKEGVGTLGEIVFTDNSSWIRSRKFRLGLRVASGGCCDGVRIREGKTEAFTVKDHRGELYKKHYPPALNDDVWRLEKIGKDGAFHKKLTAAGIFTVEDFLRIMVRDSGGLRAILGSGMSNKMWDTLAEHAQTCVLSSKLYIYYAEDSRNVGVVFNNIYEMSGLISGDQYFSSESLSESQKVYVDGLVKKAYENWNLVIEYDGKSLTDMKHPQNPQADYSTAAIHIPMQMANQSPLLSDFAIGGYDQTMVTSYPPHPQLLDSNHPRAQYEVSSGQLMGSLHQAQGSSTNNQNMNGLLALGPPQSYQNINPSASVHQADLNPFEDFFSEEEIRVRSHEMLENEDMQQFLRLFSMGGGAGNGSATHFTEDGYAFPSFLNTPMQGYDDDEDGGRSGRSVVGWLKIKAAMRWGFFIRRKAAERRAQIVELDDDEEE